MQFLPDEATFQFREIMSNSNTTTVPNSVNPSTLRVRRYRERRREGIRCLTVEMYEADIAEVTARGSLRPGGDAWNVLDAWYASHLSDVALQGHHAGAVSRRLFSMSGQARAGASR